MLMENGRIGIPGRRVQQIIVLPGKEPELENDNAQTYLLAGNRAKGHKIKRKHV